MFYNSLFMFLPTLFLTIWTGELSESVDFVGWYSNNPRTGTSPLLFTAQFLLSCFFGFILVSWVVLVTLFFSFGNTFFQDHLLKLLQCARKSTPTKGDFIYCGDLKSDHLKSGNIGNPDFLKVGFQVVGLWL